LLISGMPRFYRLLLLVQGSYTLITALWGLIDIDSFMRVTGPKNDIWLVKTVSAILAAIGISLLAFFKEKKPVFSAGILGISVAIAVAAIDFYYSGNEVIKWIYAVDGVVELVFIGGWTACIAKWKTIA
jgi:hypothetical protein